MSAVQERKTLSLGKTEKATLSLEASAAEAAQEAAQSLVEEVTRLRRQLAAAQAEISALKSKSATDGDMPVMRGDAFRSAVREAVSNHHHPAGKGCLARVRVTNLADIIAEYGDEAADYTLRHVARMLSGHVRSNDVVGRVGTGTFGVMLSFADKPGAAAKMGRLISKIQESNCIWEDQTIPITVEHSVSSLNPRDD